MGFKIFYIINLEEFTTEAQRKRSGEL